MSADTSANPLPSHVVAAPVITTEMPIDSTPANTTRVLHIINGEHYSGAERVQDLLAKCLPEFGYEVGFGCVKPDKFPVQRKSQQAPIYQFPMKSQFDLSVAKQLAALVKRENYELVHAHTARSCMVARIVATMAKVPLVYHVHSPTSSDSTRWLANRVNSWVERLSLVGVSQLVCVSESLAEHMCAQSFRPNLVSVVPNGVPSRGPMRQRSAPTDKWILGSIALFRPRKGTEVLIEALAILRGHGYDITLRAVGPFETPEYEAKMLELAKKHNVDNAIEWTGFTNDVDAELDKMDLLVLPSLFGEGLPMVVLEAMAAGVPVVGTRVQGVPEVLRDGSGIIATPGCAKNLATSIRRLIRGHESWSEIRENAWIRQGERFSDRSMASGVAKVYDTILTTIKPGFGQTSRC